MYDHLCHTLEISMFFENAWTLFDATEYSIANTKQVAPNKWEGKYDRNFDAIIEYSRTALRYSEAMREYIKQQNEILKKFIDLHFSRDGIIFLSEHGQRISKDSTLILKFEHMVVLQKSLFEGHLHSVISGFLSDERLYEYTKFTSSLLEDYIKPYLVPVRNMIAHPQGKIDYISSSDWLLTRNELNLALKIPLSATYNIGAYVEKDLSSIANDIINRSIKIIKKIIELIIQEVRARYGDIKPELIQFSKYIQGTTPNNVVKFNNDLIKLDFSQFDLEFM